MTVTVLVVANTIFAKDNIAQALAVFVVAIINRKGIENVPVEATVKAIVGVFSDTEGACVCTLLAEVDFAQDFDVFSSLCWKRSMPETELGSAGFPSIMQQAYCASARPGLL